MEKSCYFMYMVKCEFHALSLRKIILNAESVKVILNAESVKNLSCIHQNDGMLRNFIPQHDCLPKLEIEPTYLCHARDNRCPSAVFHAYPWLPTG